MFPGKLKENIYKCVEEARVGSLSAQAEQLSDRYRQRGFGKFMETEGHRLAYLLTRMPATFAAIVKVMEEVIARIPSLSLDSLLDLGAGPGTGMWAVKEVFPLISQVTLLEKDGALLSLGKKLADGVGTWIHVDIEKAEAFPKHDLVLLSYALGELTAQEKTVRRAWYAATQLLVIVEPGTVAGYERLKKIRDLLIEEGAHLIAPCPHAGSCPLKVGDWCHFSVRLSRTSLHRQMKGGTLGYEDEKFFYLVFSKNLLSSPVSGRILRHPKKQTGYVEMTVCAKEGVQQKIISRKDKENYRSARKAEWGDVL